MRFFIFSALLCLVVAAPTNKGDERKPLDPGRFVGSWKEDTAQRQGLNDYLYYRGLNWFKRVYVNNANFELTMNVAKEGNTLTISGKSMYYNFQNSKSIAF